MNIYLKNNNPSVGKNLKNIFVSYNDQKSKYPIYINI